MNAGALALWRVALDGGARVQLARGPVGEGPCELLDPALDLAALLAEDGAALAQGVDGLPCAGAVPEDRALLAPADRQPIWAAGVTFRRSLSARREESGADVYDLVYEADRPELFLKALPGEARGPGETIAVRADSQWDVPEPELALAVAASGAIAGYTLGDDVSSRSIEAANPLYLPQAKVYDMSCALGPCLVPASSIADPTALRLSLTIARGASVVYEEAVSLADMARGLGELVHWLTRATTFRHGAILLTGTSIVPTPDVTLRAGDHVTISCPALGELANPVISTPTSLEP